MANISNTLIREITEDLEESLRKAGIFYRIFSRAKGGDSTMVKLLKKGDTYKLEKRKMQDIVGIRIVFYFIEDVEIFHQYLKQNADYIDESNSSAEMNEQQKAETFAPTRLNLIFRMNQSQTETLYLDLRDFKDSHGKDIDLSLIDNTYEVQLRTVLSEGWHEVEHDLRYKCKEDKWWNNCRIESRMLNGIYASLETNERALEVIFSNMAYKNYKNHEWVPMLRNHFRLRFVSQNLDTSLKEILDNNNDIAKEFLRYERSFLQEKLFKLSITYPLNINNLIFLLNRLTCDSENIRNKEPNIIKDKLDKIAQL
jgi:relA/spoT protein